MTPLILPRRGFLAGLGSLILAPAVVKAENLMPIQSLDRFYFRGLVDYHIGLDELFIRIDQANFALPTPKYIAGVIPFDEIKRILNGFDPHILKQLKPIGPNREQKNITMALKGTDVKVKWNDPGPYSDWDIPK